MKVIDLLNKIANGEETHFDTKLNDKSVSVRYYNDRNFSSSTDPEMLTIADIIKSLNDEVEIIEEDKKIEKIQQRTDTGLFGSMVNDEIKVAEAINKQANYLSDIVSTINEIIDKLNEMEKE